MIDNEVMPEERQLTLLEELRRRGSMTVEEAWYFGHSLGFYRGGEGSVAKSDLNALCQQNQARRTDGFWRHAHEPDHIRQKYKKWADYWTPIRRGGK
jgi:hypothetical protein